MLFVLCLVYVFCTSTLYLNLFSVFQLFKQPFEYYCVPLLSTVVNILKENPPSFFFLKSYILCVGRRNEVTMDLKTHDIVFPFVVMNKMSRWSSQRISQRTIRPVFFLFFFCNIHSLCSSSLTSVQIVLATGNRLPLDC